MCLDIKKGQKPKITKKDIIVWKHIINNSDYYYWGPSDYVSSYEKAPIVFNTVIHSEIDRQLYSIEKALHSFEFEEDASEEANSYEEVLVKCIIPKSSIYYKGTFGNKNSYASNQLIYQEIIKY